MRGHRSQAAAKADSNGRRNINTLFRKELVESFSKCFPTERFARSCVHRVCDRVQFIGCVIAEISAFRKVLP